MIKNVFNCHKHLLKSKLPIAFIHFPYFNFTKHMKGRSNNNAMRPSSKSKVQSSNSLKYLDMKFFENKIIALERKIKASTRNRMHPTLDNETEELIADIENNEEEGIESPVIVEKLVFVYASLKVIPREKLLNKILLCLETNDPFDFFNNFKQEEILRFMENLILIKKALTKKNVFYYRIAGVISKYLNAFTGNTIKATKHRLLSYLIVFNYSDTRFLTLTTVLTNELWKFLSNLTLKESLSVLWVASIQGVFFYEPLNKILENVLKTDILTELMLNENNFLLQINYLISYSNWFLETVGSNHFPKLLNSHIDKIYDHFHLQKKLTNKEYVEFYIYYTMMNNTGKMESIHYELEEVSLFIRLTNYHKLLNLHRQNKDKTALTKYLLNRVNDEKMLTNENYSVKLKILSSIFSSNLFKSLDENALFNLLAYRDLFHMIVPFFNTTIQILPILNDLIQLNPKMIENYFIAFLKEENHITRHDYTTFMNIIYIAFSLNLDNIQNTEMNIVDVTDKFIKRFTLEEDTYDKFLSIEQKLIYNSILQRVNIEYKIKSFLHEINEPEIKIHRIAILQEVLKDLIKKTRFAMFIEKDYILDKIYYFDYFIPSMNMGILIIEDNNIFESKKVSKLEESFSIVSKILKEIYKIRLVLIDSKQLLNKPEDIEIILARHLLDKAPLNN